MLRIPNPVSDPRIFLRIFRDIYSEIKDRERFGLDDISRAMVATNNVTSQGAIGVEALRRSTRYDRSLDPIYNQSKMYSELFRTLGWIQSASNSALTFHFSLLGLHIAAANDPAPLMRECLLGIAYPNEVLGVKGNHTVRPISTILLVMDALGSISRDEMMAGPMSLDDDTDPAVIASLVLELKQCRSNPQKLDAWLDHIAAECRIKRGSTMTNYTRFPIGVVRGSGWSNDQRGKALVITPEGSAIASRLNKAPDFRLTHFARFNDEAKPAFIRWTFYKMLERAGFNIDPVRNVIEESTAVLKKFELPFLGDVFFSPFQQLSRETILSFTPDLVPATGSSAGHAAESLSEAMADATGPVVHERTALIFEITEEAAHIASSADALITEMRSAISIEKSVSAATDVLLAAYSHSNRDVFYPLVANLFCILGFDCRVSRGGQNYERADAIILDKAHSVPVEIKSPGEETEISVKAVRQALENKIILLSRKSYSTDWDTTSLVVGFNPPNERSEVHELVEDIHKAFNIRVGVVDFRSLVYLAVMTVATGKKLNLTNITQLKGVIRVDSVASVH